MLLREEGLPSRIDLSNKYEVRGKLLHATNTGWEAMVAKYLLLSIPVYSDLHIPFQHFEMFCLDILGYPVC